jgi:anaerobic selenocysteine-containing dehydrogenase
VLIAAEYGRSAAWRQIGYIAGRLARARGGGVAAQTAGLNALAAVRLAGKLGAVSLAEALAEKAQCVVAVGCDVLGMLGLADEKILAAAAAFPNRSAEAAGVVLPTTMPVECSGSWLFAGKGCQNVRALLEPPAGVPVPAEIVAALASEAGVATPQAPAVPDPTEPLKAEGPAAAPAWADPSRPVLLLARQAAQAGCGALTSHGSWQRNVQPLPEARISPDDARQMDLKNASVAKVRAGGRCVEVQVTVAPELPAGRIVLPEASAEARALMPCRIDSQSGVLAAMPVSASVSR